MAVSEIASAAPGASSTRSARNGPRRVASPRWRALSAAVLLAWCTAQPLPNSTPSNPDSLAMDTGDAFLTGEIFRILRMPDGGMIFTLSLPRPAKDFAGVEHINHNVFRVDKSGQVLWQVTRIDHPEVNWEAKHRHAREEGLPGCIEPFMEFVLRLPNGMRYPEGDPVDSIDWVPGCRVDLVSLGIGTQWFRLDVDSGVATEITSKGTRPW
jgi:hypothetical protein